MKLRKIGVDQMRELLPNVVRVLFMNPQALYQSYMSFLRNGGLYLPLTDTMPPMGAPIFILAQLPESTDIYFACGTVCYINNGRRTGAGIHFETDEATQRLNLSIQNSIAPLIASGATTLTM